MRKTNVEADAGASMSVWLITGAQTAGKSTVADLLAREFERGVYVRGGQAPAAHGFAALSPPMLCFEDQHRSVQGGHRMRLQHIFPTLAVLLLSVSIPSWSHHGWSGNTAGEIELTGEVVSGVRLSGPHGTMQIRDADGRLWDITLAPGPRTHRAGLREDTIPVGAEVTVHGERHEDPEVFEAKVRRVIWEDEIFDVYPPRD